MLAFIIAAASLSRSLSVDEMCAFEAGAKEALVGVDIETLDAATARTFLLAAMNGVISDGELDVPALKDVVQGQAEELPIVPVATAKEATNDSAG